MAVGFSVSDFFDIFYGITENPMANQPYDARKEREIEQILKTLLSPDGKGYQYRGNAISTTEAVGIAENISELVKGFMANLPNLPRASKQALDSLGKYASKRNWTEPTISEAKERFPSHAFGLLALYLWKYRKDLFRYFMDFGPTDELETATDSSGAIVDFRIRRR